MSQFLRPDSNVTQTNFTNGYAEIDESVADDTDYATGGTGGSATLEVGLSNPSGTPSSARPVTVRFRAMSNGGTFGSSSITCYVYEGATLRATSATVDPSGSSFTTYSFSPDLSAVSDWTNLRLRFVTDAHPNSCRLSWAEMEVDQAVNWTSTLTESTTAGDSRTNVAAMVSTVSEAATPADLYTTSSNSNIHAFARLPFGEIWFAIPTGDGATHTYFSFCVDESQAAQQPVWFKGTINATAIVDDPLLGVDAPWSCLRIAEGTSANLYSFDRRDDGEIEVDWNLTSSAFYVDEADRRVLIKRYYPDFEVRDGSVSLQILTYDFPSGANVAGPTLTIADGDTFKDFRVSGRLMKMKFSGSGHCRLGKPAFDITDMGER